MKSKDKGAYALSGVDITNADTAKDLIKAHTRSTFRSEVLTDIGLFGGMFALKSYKEPVLISSADGVGTKIKIATLLKQYDTIGIDLVNHCVNDILCCGAEPLFFLDYVGTGKLVPGNVEKVVSGLAQACRDAGCALIGGETAEMPGVYHGKDFDLVGFIVGVVEKEKVLIGSLITSGDCVLGLPSSGLHTNGYSLVRKVFNIKQDPSPLNVTYPELGISLGEELLKPHKCYYTAIRPLLPSIKAMAHITGGGLVGNLPRVLPEGLAINIEKNSWQIPPIFKLIKRQGDIDEGEMYRVFNMGIGMAIICSTEHEHTLRTALPELMNIGKVVPAYSDERISIS